MASYISDADAIATKGVKTFLAKQMATVDQ